MERHGEHSAHAFLAAPYGTYPTSDGYIALAMNPIPRLGALLELPARGHDRPAGAWDRQEEIESGPAPRFALGTTQSWLDVLDAADVWCAPVLTLEELLASEGFAALRVTPSRSSARGHDLHDTQSAADRRQAADERQGGADPRRRRRERAGRIPTGTARLSRPGGRPVTTVLKGITWEHARGYGSVAAASAHTARSSRLSKSSGISARCRHSPISHSSPSSSSTTCS